MSYAQKLELAKKHYPFEKWLTYDMDMYMEESCGKAQISLSINYGWVSKNYR